MKESYDVVVIGGGPGGCAAAAGAAAEGADVLLVEAAGCLGGMATSGLVNPFMPYTLEGRSLANPFFNELIDRLEAAGALDETRKVFDDEMMKYVLDRMMAERGVDVLLHARYVSSGMEAGRIRTVTIAAKEGLVRVGGKVFVDSSGDGDLAAFSGARVETGREEDGLCQPMTLCFRIGGIDVTDPLWTGSIRGIREKLTEVFLEAKAAGRITCPREDVLVFKTLVPGVLHFNTTRVVGKSGLVSRDLTEAEVEGRRQAVELYRLFKERVPAFRNSFLLKTAASIGVRETRRVMGSYVLGEEDVVNARKHPDGVARSNYPIDIHNPTGEGTVLKAVPSGDYYEIPYRCLVPEGVDNLLVGSRCVSATHAGHSSLRVMPVVASLGEAAGRAAAWSAARGIPPAAIDTAALREKLGLAE